VAILDALQKNVSLKDATLYSTLLPDNKDSQMIREVGIKRVVYEQEKYVDRVFVIASKKILEGLEWR
jgi:deoxycytidylate deaminase